MTPCIAYNSFSVAFKMPEIFEFKVTYPPKKGRSVQCLNGFINQRGIHSVEVRLG